MAKLALADRNCHPAAYIKSLPSRPDAMPKSKKKTGEPEAK
jgi:hypothetical protein